MPMIQGQASIYGSIPRVATYHSDDPFVCRDSCCSFIVKPELDFYVIGCFTMNAVGAKKLSQLTGLRADTVRNVLNRVHPTRPGQRNRFPKWGTYVVIKSAINQLIDDRDPCLLVATA